MDVKFDFEQGDGERIVYVRPVKVADLPEELQAQAKAMGTIYAVCNEDGEQLALVGDRKLAFVLARQNDLEPVPVH